MAVNIFEHEDEPVPGLPGELPESEQLLWQGAPDWLPFATHVFHLRKLIIYFAVLVAISIAYNLAQGHDATSVLAALSWQLMLATVVIGLLAWLAKAYSRVTLYTITNQRLVMRFGVALPMMINIPWDRIEAGDMKCYKDGTGDISLKPIKGSPVSYMMIWPNARPWHWSPAYPTLRAINQPEAVSSLLATVLERNGTHQRSDCSNAGAAGRATPEVVVA